MIIMIPQEVICNHRDHTTKIFLNNTSIIKTMTQMKVNKTKKQKEEETEEKSER